MKESLITLKYALLVVIIFMCAVVAVTIATLIVTSNKECYCKTTISTGKEIKIYEDTLEKDKSCFDISKKYYSVIDYEKICK